MCMVLIFVYKLIKNRGQIHWGGYFLHMVMIQTPPNYSARGWRPGYIYMVQTGNLHKNYTWKDLMTMIMNWI